MLTALIQQLLIKQNLTKKQCFQALNELISNENPIQSGAFVLVLQSKPIHIEEFFAFYELLKEQMIHLALSYEVIDIVGTGGDQANTVNISTAASILVASCGVKVVKHGNRSVSSLCGSADLLEGFKIKLNLAPDQIVRCVNEIGISFCFAPNFHPVLLALKNLRRSLKVPTFFNWLGPLLNPAQPKFYLLGVSDSSKMDLMADVLLRAKVKHAFVVHSQGLDELSLLGSSEVIEIKDNSSNKFILDPVDFGFKYCQLSDIQGDKVERNCHLITKVFQGEKNPLADTIIFNAGVALYLSENCSSIESGIEKAQKQIENGSAINLLKAWQQFCKKL